MIEDIDSSTVFKANFVADGIRDLIPICIINPTGFLANPFNVIVSENTSIIPDKTGLSSFISFKLSFTILLYCFNDKLFLLLNKSSP